MKERPILFSGPMVRAILEGRKTQTRRVLNMPTGWSLESQDGDPYTLGMITSSHPKKGKFGAFIRQDIHPGSGKFMTDVAVCPYGKVGDRLWVRETWRLFNSADECACHDSCDCSRMHGKPLYRATDDDGASKWKPSIHMPRWASRIALEITGVRVERLQDISEEDAKAEGVTATPYPEKFLGADGQVHESPVHKMLFLSLWESISGFGSWSANPWVWVIEFRRVV